MQSWTQGKSKIKKNYSAGKNSLVLLQKVVPKSSVAMQSHQQLV